MCFSAPASFIVGTSLLPVGAYSLWAAVRKRPSGIGFALIPLFFGIQQISEGFVWLGLEHNNPQQTQTGSLVFLFFALALWPFWFPLFATLLETQPTRKWIMAVISVIALGWFWILYYPLLLEPNLLETKIVQHSIQYQYDHLVIYTYIDKLPLRLLYFATLAVPMLLSTEPWGRLPGVVLALLAVISALVFEHAFVSVWCFFAAVMALYTGFVFWQLPTAGESAATP